MSIIAIIGKRWMLRNTSERNGCIRLVTVSRVTGNPPKEALLFREGEYHLLQSDAERKAVSEFGLQQAAALEQQIRNPDCQDWYEECSRLRLLVI